MQIAVASSSWVGVSVLQALAGSSHEISYVITNPDKKSGRGQNILENDFAQAARVMRLDVRKPSNREELRELISSHPVDLVVTIAYGTLIKEELLNLPKFGWMNIHFSKLPRFRGAAPVQRAILEGASDSGITFFKLDVGMDTGPVYEMLDVEILPEDTTPSLLERMSKIAADRLPALLDEIANGKSPVEQRGVGASHAGKFSKEDGRLVPSLTVEEFSAKVRALSDNPGTFLSFRGAQLGVALVQNPSEVVEVQPIGTLTATKKSLFLQLSNGHIELVTVVPQGKKAMSGADFARGARLTLGELCE